MNLNTYKELVQGRIRAQMDGCLTILSGIVPRPAAVHETKEGPVVLPAKTLEDIALATVDATSMIRAYQMAHAIVQEEFDKIMKPSQAPVEADNDDDGTSNDPNHEGGIYG